MYLNVMQVPFGSDTSFDIYVTSHACCYCKKKFKQYGEYVFTYITKGRRF